ncbi:MAG: peptidoglycan-binding protein [Patescibacteria group bacterium]|nr:peptidoglycan-binding protein [Patescibacteria group bacterium]MDE1945891.1 peptidoglycan-binding protein [Patescibacteria group bacterium]
MADQSASVSGTLKINLGGSKNAGVVPTPVPASASMPITFLSYLSVGSKGPRVVALQKYLGIDPADGHFGPATRKAVMKFQTEHNLKRTGTLNKATRAALNAELFVQVAAATVPASVTPSATATASVTITPTPSIKPVKKFSPADTHLQIGLSGVSASPLLPGTLPPGFQFLGSDNLGAEIAVKGKADIFALAFDLNLAAGQVVKMETYGSSLNQIMLRKEFDLIGELYPCNRISGMPLFPFLGVGVEKDVLSGNFSMGGFPFQSSVTDVVPIYLIGTDIPVADHLICSFEYEVRSVTMTTNLPGVGDLQFSQLGNLVAGLELTF